MDRPFMGTNMVVIFQQLASHGLFDVHVKATGDVHIDDHHTNEDVALAIGTVLPTAMLAIYFFSFWHSLLNVFLEIRTCFTILG